MDDCQHNRDDIVWDKVMGEDVCTACGLVLMCGIPADTVAYAQDVPVQTTYFRRHYVEERKRQLICEDSPIPRDDMEEIHAAYRVKYKQKVATRTRIRAILKELRKSEKMPHANKYVKKWIQIRHCLMRTKPVAIDMHTNELLESAFGHFDRVFNLVKPAWKKSMISYSFLFSMVFLRCGRFDLAAYFPPAKSKEKRIATMVIWQAMRQHLDWPDIDIPPPKFYKDFR